MTPRFSITNIPKGDFTAKSIADRFYPNSVSQDSEGRVYNRAIPTVFRLLRKMNNILEVGKGTFYNGT